MCFAKEPRLFKKPWWKFACRVLQVAKSFFSFSHRQSSSNASEPVWQHNKLYVTQNVITWILLFSYAEAAIVNYNDNGCLSHSPPTLFMNKSRLCIFNIFRYFDLQTMESFEGKATLSLIEFSNKFMLFELKCIQSLFFFLLFALSSNCND